MIITEKIQTLFLAGNIVHLFFTPGNSWDWSKFKKGECKIKDLKFSLYLLRKISNLVNKYGKNNIQAYAVREMIKIGYVGLLSMITKQWITYLKNMESLQK